MLNCKTEFVFAGRIVSVDHETTQKAHDYAHHVLATWPKTVKSVDIRTPERSGSKFLGTIKSKGE